MFPFEFLNASIDKKLAIAGVYEPILVLLSIALVFPAAYTVTTAVDQIKKSDHLLDKIYGVGLGAMALSSGVFSMHFIGMMAYSLPIPVHYNLKLTLFSLLPVFIASTSSMLILSSEKKKHSNQIFPGILFGSGIVGMHYTGMLAMRLDASMVFDPGIVVLSLILAVGLAILSLNTERVLPLLKLAPDTVIGKTARPLVLSLAASGMHYTAMAATWFFPLESAGGGLQDGIDSRNLSYIVVAILFCVQTFALFAVNFNLSQLKTGEASLDKSPKVRKILIRKFAQIYIPQISLLFFAIAIGQQFYYSSLKSDVENQSLSDLELSATHALHDFEVIFDDLKLILKDRTLANALENRNPQTIELLGEEFIEIAEESDLFRQIRYIDESGMEIVRVDSKDGLAFLLPQHLLQDKSDRYYFRESMRLDQNQIYISPFDLNVEKKMVEVPIVPIIRFSAPVFDSRGKNRGIIILNFDGNIVLDSIRDIFGSSSNQVFFLNREGYFLIGPSPEMEWGFMFQREIRFQDIFPFAWNSISKMKSGLLETETAIMAFRTIQPQMRKKGEFNIANEIQWKLIVSSPLPRVYSLSRIRQHPFILSMILWVLMVMTIVSWYFSRSSLRIEQSEKKNRTLFRELTFMKNALDEHSIVSVTDVRGNILSINDKFCEISGFCPEDLVGQNHRIVRSGEHSPAFYKNLWKTIGKGKVWHGEIKNIKKDGGFYWVAATIVPFINEEGKPFQYIGIRTDITEAKQIEKDLERAVNEADAANQAKSDFLANMSHEIRTPMNGILGMMRLCLQTDLNAKQQDYLNKALNSASSLLEIINDILDFSKIEAGKLEIDRVAFNLDEVLINVGNLVSFKLQKNDVEFLFQISDEVPRFLMGDPIRLGQILLNLAGNGLKFTEKGEVVLSVSVLNEEKTHTDSDTVSLQFQVRDTGIGMTETQLGKLFQSFSQADISTTRKYGGTGLGLSICKRLVEMMGGEIWVESETGKGSTFGFKLSFSKQETKPKAEVLPQSLNFEGKRVLVVDDNEAARQILCEVLKSFSFQVEEAPSGQKAIEILVKADPPFDLVLMDWKMPEMDGIQAIEAIRSHSGILKQAKIILQTAYGREELVTQVKELELDGFLMKPVTSSILLDTVAKVFGSESQAIYPKIVSRKFDHDLLKSIQGARILLVEDNEINQQVAQELLEGVQFFVDIAKNGEEAVEKVKNKEYDAVLMDIQMPIMDGYQATAEIRRDPGFRNLPIIAMTAKTMAGDYEISLKLGLNDHVSKPIDTEELFSVLLKWIEAKERNCPETERALPEEAPAEILPEKLAGLDIAGGLARIGGSIKSYKSLINKFYQKQANTLEEIRAALKTGDFDRAAGIAHTIKGISGNIGATDLYNAVRDLEEGIEKTRSGQYLGEELEMLLLPAQSHLEQVLSAIRKLTSEQKEITVNSGSIDWTVLVPLLSELAGYLENYSTKATNCVEELSKHLNGSEAESVLKKIEQCILQYDFEGASVLLTQLREILNIKSD
ncbi:MAG: response regulator [SAR324 cluster bacterium]|nr:response regulator [SAR324 cluster bacterium]